MKSILIILFLFISCSKEEFASRRNLDTVDVPLTFNTTAESCSNYTLIRPYVDFLFLWDNTSSQVFVSNETKQSLRQTINLISDRFDYHILLAPLVGQTSGKTFLIARNENGLSQSALNIKIDETFAENALESFTTSSSSSERGIQRVNDLIETNRSNGIFRKNSYVVVVVMSNGNDQFTTSSGYYDGPSTQSYITSEFNRFKDLITERESIKSRFISLVAHSPCKPGWRYGETYKTFSNKVHEDQYNCNQNSNNDFECSSNTPDSHDICGIEFSNLFDAINNSVTDTVIKHKYDHWPISFQEDPILFDRDSIKIFKSTGEEVLEVDGESPEEDGWVFLGWKNGQPTTYEPFIGESKNAYMVKLQGNAKVTYPECLLVSFESPTYYYGYAPLSAKPLDGSIKVKKNGELLPEDAWEFLGFKASQNLRIMGPNNPEDPFVESFPADYATNNYIIRFSEDFVYMSGDIIEITFDPTGT